MPKDKKGAPFEQLYAKLDERVSRLEQGGLSLEESIALYEEGMQLARECQQRLDAAELRITTLRESFASITPRNGASIHEPEPEPDYEYVNEDAAAGDDEEPFA